MFSILDILKKHREEKKRLAGQPETPVLPAGVSFQSVSDTRKDQISIFTAVNKEMVEENMRLVSGLYDESLALARRVYSPKGPDAGAVKDELDPFLARVAGTLAKGDRESLQFILSDYPDIKEYLIYHVVNVCLLSVELGLELKLEAPALAELAKAAFLHDIGIAQFADLIAKPSKLSAEEIAMIRTHPKAGRDLIDRICKDSPHAITDTILQEHERQDGSGYPKGLKENDICEPAQIVAVADVYEALIHSRPYRQRSVPSAALTAILDSKSAFSSRVIKALIERVGIYPVGTRVKLNTKETGVVVQVNAFSPLRPVVSVIQDAQGIELKTPKEINLYKNYLVHIEENLGK